MRRLGEGARENGKDATQPDFAAPVTLELEARHGDQLSI